METFDTHRAVKELQAAGFGDSQAEALVNTIGAANAAMQTFATKEDLSALATRLEERMDAMHGRLEERLVTSAELLEHRLTVKFGVGIVATVAAVVGLIRGLDFLIGY